MRPEEAAVVQHLARCVSGGAIVTLGRRGCLVASAAVKDPDAVPRAVHVPAVTVPPDAVKDATGAGGVLMHITSCTHSSV